MADPPIYSIDTSAIVNGWWRQYPPDVFPALWEKIDELIASGRLVASSEVLRELSKQNDDVYQWAKDRKHMFIEIDNRIESVVAKIMAEFPRLVDANRNRSAADPFVIALAVVSGGIVVTDEKHKPSEKRPPHIPDVCEAMGVKFITLLLLAREQGWVFKGE